MRLRFEPETTRRLFPARSPMLPAVEVILRVGEVRVDVKLPAVIELLADKVMEFVPVMPAANASPPAVDVTVSASALRVAAALEVMEPVDNTSNAAPAPDAAAKLVEAPVFWMKTFWPAAFALTTRFGVLTTRRLLPARSPILPAVEDKLIAAELSGVPKLPPRILSWAARVIEFGPLRPPLRDNPALVDVSEMSFAEIDAPAPDVIAFVESKLKVAPAELAADMFEPAPVFWTNTFCPAVAAFADRLEVLTTSLALPARSPILPLVDVRLTVPEVRFAAKLPCCISLRAVSEIEVVPVRLPANVNPPLVDVTARSVAERLAPAPDETPPFESKLNVPAAAEEAAMLVEAPVFWMNTF